MVDLEKKFTIIKLILQVPVKARDAEYNRICFQELQARKGRNE
jgi:hypothetical protein